MGRRPVVFTYALQSSSSASSGYLPALQRTAISCMSSCWDIYARLMAAGHGDWAASIHPFLWLDHIHVKASACCSRWLGQSCRLSSV